jgi:hypothetical protein
MAFVYFVIPDAGVAIAKTQDPDGSRYFTMLHRVVGKKVRMATPIVSRDQIPNWTPGSFGRSSKERRKSKRPRQISLAQQQEQYSPRCI